MRLMGSVPVGRIVYTRQALPAVELVNFALDDGDIIIRTDAGGKLAAATRGAVVAFEADSVDVTGHAGWSVTVVGHARAVTDGEEIRRLEQLAAHPMGAGKARPLHPDLAGDRERAADRAPGSWREAAMRVLSERQARGSARRAGRHPAGRGRRQLRHPVAGPVGARRRLSRGTGCSR